MSQTTPSKYRNTLLIEIIAEKTGFNSLSARLLGSSSYGPYLFVTIGLFIEYGIFDIYNYSVSGKSSFVTEPNSLAIPAMTIFGLLGVRYIHDGYATAVVDLGVEDDHTNIDPDIRQKFEELLSFRVRLGAYFAALICYYGFIVVVLGIPELIEISGYGLVAYGQLVTFPLIIIPILTELAISYIAVHILVPRRLKEADIGLFFYDPLNLGGFEPVGDLLKRSYYIYTGILLLWFLQTHLPVMLEGIINSPYPAPGPIFQAMLTAIWICGVISIGYSMFRIHNLMESKKSERLRTLENELKAAVDDPYNPSPTNITKREQFDDTQEQIEQVRQTKTYPTTFTMWSQIFLSALLPQALNMVVQLPQ